MCCYLTGIWTVHQRQVHILITSKMQMSMYYIVRKNNAETWEVNTVILTFEGELLLSNFQLTLAFYPLHVWLHAGKVLHLSELITRSPLVFLVSLLISYKAANRYLVRLFPALWLLNMVLLVLKSPTTTGSQLPLPYST